MYKINFIYLFFLEKKAAVVHMTGNILNGGLQALVSYSRIEYNIPTCMR